MRHRLRTHLLNFDDLTRATYAGGDDELLEGEVLGARLGSEVAAFLEKRATFVAAAARHLADGRMLALEQSETEARLFLVRFLQ